MTAENTNASFLKGVTISDTPPANGQTLTYNSSTIEYVPTTPGGGGGGLTWAEVTGTSQAAGVSTGYILNNAGLVTVTLPATAAIGDIIRIAGKGAGGWKLAQNASQLVYFGSLVTTTGAGGALDSTNAKDSIEILCVATNTDFEIISSIGSITVT